MKKLLAILGSPHKNGSSAAMLSQACETAEDAGWEVTTIYLYEEHISFCTGCRKCMQHGICIYEDGIQKIARLLKCCDAVVLSAPVYWANVPAAVKNMFDRLLGTAMEDTAAFPRPRLSKNQKYLILTSCNTPFPFSWICGQSRGAIRAMDEFFKTSGMKSMGRITWAGAKGSPDLPDRTVKKIRRCFSGSYKIRVM
ncbi:flavodoxin family protein [Clostridium sp. AM58-1XD]|uniref:flavodoxin family protein n=1 Tax=Clostridium sp. AM58-1XD TaxID=2292307 RepID=UPI000E486B17|nr:flavodoxin family protein [Clostridium sp. AM58-1XD]RGY94859.1 flavodoxin family protein [Clostridium sp. AM58-1XD]